MYNDLFYVAEPTWVEPLLVDAEAALTQHPPCHPPSEERQAALMMLDGPLHLVNANRFRSTQDFLVRRLTHAIESIEQCNVAQGARLWKLYNHGFVLRTPTVTIGMDVVRGWRFWEAPEEYYGLSPHWVDRLVAQIDLFTITHNHGDHHDLLIRDRAMARGAAMIAEDSVFANLSEHPGIRRPQRDPSGQHPTELNITTKRGAEINLLVYPGHQGADVANNVYLLRTPEGFTVMHTGDQSGELDWGWIDSVQQRTHVNLLLPNCWTTDMTRLVRGVQPDWVIFGHEVEMSHTPDHRESYWRSFQLFRDLAKPRNLVLGWGEEVTIPH